MGLLVDIPIASSGNTNTGNTARRFLRKPELVARITGFSKEIIYKFSVILRVLASGHEIDTEAFRSYAMETAEMFVKLYPWYYMPASIHKILIHGADVINHVALPIGLMSEEALEARNKDFRRIRLSHSRKDKRVNTMQDVMNGLFISSVPFIISLSKSSRLPKRPVHLHKDVIRLLAFDNNSLVDSDTSDSE